MNDYRFPFKGEEPVLGWSAYMTGGWKAQYDRVIRWHEQIKNAKTIHDKLDFLYAFFENALNMRDWLKKTEPDKVKEVDDFYEIDNYMKICRDLANMHKHFTYDKNRKPCFKPTPSEGREYWPDGGSLDPKSSHIILCAGKKFDAFELSDLILKALQDFITKHFPTYY